jgi:hypothetical protein
MNRRDIIKLAAVILVLVLAVMLAGRIERSQGAEETEIVRKAIKEAAITCYAVEGAYPDDIDYLRQYYHLSYDEDRYLVTYNAFASNHIPDIYVTERGAKK